MCHNTPYHCTSLTCFFLRRSNQRKHQDSLRIQLTVCHTMCQEGTARCSKRPCSAQVKHRHCNRHPHSSLTRRAVTHSSIPGQSIRQTAYVSPKASNHWARIFTSTVLQKRQYPGQIILDIGSFARQTVWYSCRSGIRISLADRLGNTGCATSIYLTSIFQISTPCVS